MMTDLNPIDRAALDLAIATARKESPARRQIDGMLAAGQSYERVGKFAAQCCRMNALDLMPWQLPPCYPDMRALDQHFGDPGGKRESANWRRG
jgi:hypothetical protein